MNSLCRCSICGREERVDFAVCLRRGWPTCCKGYTMTLITTSADVARATESVLRAQEETEP